MQKKKKIKLDVRTLNIPFATYIQHIQVTEEEEEKKTYFKIKNGPCVRVSLYMSKF